MRALGEQAYCLFRRRGGWSEVRLQDEDAARARLVVLSDHRMVLVHPPESGELSTARLTVVDGTRSAQVALIWPSLKPDAERALRSGTWMDGFEQRGPGVVGGWVDAAGSVIGVEIRIDGETRVGEYIHDAGSPVVSGRWGLGWTASRRGFETTDGGMTWRKGIDVPEPILPARLVRERACGPIGCIAAGWLRIGWGETESGTPPEPSMRVARDHAARALALDCRPAAGLPHAPADAPVPGTPSGTQPVHVVHSWSGARLGIGASGYGSLTDFPPCLGRAGPAIPTSDRGLPPTEAATNLERSLRSTAPVACVYAWGPKSGDWDQLGHWEARWASPWGGSNDARSSAVTPAPWTSQDGARHALGQGGGQPTVWALASGEDADHALLVARHTAGPPSSDILVLESDRAPVEVRRSGGDPFPDVEGATRVSGRWYVSTSQPQGDLAATVVWALDGASVREVARLPRPGNEKRPPTRLARRTDGRAVGLVVDGQPDAIGGVAMRWVVGIDLESAAVSDPEPLAPVDLSDRDVSLCTGDDSGWTLDAPYPGAIRLHGGTGGEVSLEAVLARVRLTRDRACFERLLGSSGSPPEALLAQSEARPRGDVRTIDVNVFSGRSRFPMRCSKR
jgi:hypothetical protein